MLCLLNTSTSFGASRQQRRRWPAASLTPPTVRRCSINIQASAPAWNPQNVPDPKVMPSVEFTPLQALKVQLQAISNNDDPWVNHGVQTMYEFAEEAGSMERSRYFGFSKDLYHFDHFLVFKTKCAELVDCASFEVLPGPPEAMQQQQGVPPGMEVFYVSVIDSQGRDGGVFEFKLVQREMGLRKGCWMTKSCIKVL